MKIKDFKLERFFAKYEFTAPYLLSSSDCEALSIGDLMELTGTPKEELDKVWLGYTESLGDPVLRKEITKLYSTIGDDELIVTAGAEEGIFVFMNVALQKGDHVIFQFPGYQSLYEIANSIGCEVSPWRMNGEQEWDNDELRSLINADTKAIILNLPHNPTGYIPSKEQFKEIFEIAEENGIIVFNDEVYRYLEYNPEDTLPAAADMSENTVSLGVMSKTYGLAGLRIGWLATKNRELYTKMASFKDFTSICNSAPSEFLSLIALRNKEKLVKRNIGIIERNLELLDSFFEKYSNLFEWSRPKAGSIAFPKIKFDQNVDDFCIDVVEKKGVLLLPSTLYDFDDKHFRVGFGRKNMPEALAKLEEYVEEEMKP